jgi:Rha family phage regulatory protein
MTKAIKTVESDDWGVKGIRGRALVGSRIIAQRFSKQHKDVMKTIRNAISDLQETSAQFCADHFIESTYKDNGRTYPEYLLTKDGFTYIVMGFTGKEAAQFKVGYITRFNRMEDYLLNRGEAKSEYKSLMDSVKENTERLTQWTFSNEANMINLIVLGKKAKTYREDNGIESKETRAYLTAEQMFCINRLQKVDYGLVEAGMDYQQRKDTLAKYYREKLVPKLVLLGD